MLLMSCLDPLNDCLILFLLCHIDSIVQVFSNNRLICRNDNDIHSVDVSELLFLCERCTGHTGLLCVFVEEVLECDGCECLRLSLDLDVLLRLYCLVKAVRIPSSRKYTSCELIDNQDFVILHDIITITEHQIMCTECKNDIVLNLNIFRVRQVVNMEELLTLLNSLLSQSDDLVLLIHNEITCLSDLLAHNSGHLRDFAACLPLLKLASQHITDLVQLCRLSTLTGNNQRRSCFINKDRVDLVDDGIIQLSLNQSVLINNHVVTKIVKSILVIRYICDVLRILCASLL